MNDIDGTILGQIRKLLTDPPEYRVQGFAYLRSLMKMCDQKRLIETLKKLNYYEMKMALAAGIPGHANTVAKALARDLRRKVDQAVQRETASVSVVIEDVPIVEEDEEDAEGVHTSETRREEDR